MSNPEYLPFSLVSPELKPIFIPESNKKIFWKVDGGRLGLKSDILFKTAAVFFQKDFFLGFRPPSNLENGKRKVSGRRKVGKKEKQSFPAAG